MKAIADVGAFAPASEFVGRNPFDVDKQIVHPRLRRKAHGIGGFLYAVELMYSAAQIIDSQILGKFFGAYTGPFGEYPLEMFGRQVYLGCHFGQIWLFAKIPAQILNSLGHTLVVQLRWCHGLQF